MPPYPDIDVDFPYTYTDAMKRPVERFGIFDIRYTMSGSAKRYFCEVRGSYPTRFLYTTGLVDVMGGGQSIYFDNITDARTMAEISLENAYADFIV